MVKASTVTAMNHPRPGSPWAPNVLTQVWSGWDSVGEQWFIEIYASDEDDHSFKYTLNNADREYTKHLFRAEAHGDRSSADQLFDQIWATLKHRGYEPARFEPCWFEVPSSIYLDLKSGAIPYNTTLVTNQRQIVVFDVVNPDGPSPLVDTE